MLCSHCGRDISDGSQFCNYCGADLRSPATAPELSFDLSTPPTASNAPLTFDLSTPAQATTTTSSQSSARKSGLIGVLIALGVMLMKFKTVIIAVLLKFKSLLALAKFGKIFTTTGTMLLSIWVYATLWGWKFATGFVVLMFVHEMGHALVLWRKGVKASAPMFIPFMGAVIVQKQRSRDVLEDAQIAYGGPALGTVGALAAWALYGLTGNVLFLALASVAFWLNLFNLIPLPPLDGGWIMGAISPKLWLIGLPLLFIRFLQTHNGFLLFIVFVSLFHFKGIWRNAWHPDEKFYQVSPKMRALVTVLYVGLAVFLGWAHSHTHDLLMEFIRPARSI